MLKKRMHICFYDKTYTIFRWDIILNSVFLVYSILSLDSVSIYITYHRINCVCHSINTRIKYAQNRAEQSRIEQNRTEQNRTDQNWTELNWTSNL